VHISFSHLCSLTKLLLLMQTVATGLVPDNNAVLPEPLKLGKSLVYLTDTVLLPSSSGEAVPNPARRRR
jgi:hypothetical protein